MSYGHFLHPNYINIASGVLNWLAGKVESQVTCDQRHCELEKVKRLKAQNSIAVIATAALTILGTALTSTAGKALACLSLGALVLVVLSDVDKVLSLRENYASHPDHVRKLYQKLFGAAKPDQEIFSREMVSHTCVLRHIANIIY